MKALVFGGPGQRSWDTADDPGIQDPTDVIVKVDTTTICGTDLHILKGDVPAVTEGRILGHEAVGTVVETGAAVSSLKEGDRVLVPAITSVGSWMPGSSAVSHERCPGPPNTSAFIVFPFSGRPACQHRRVTAPLHG